MKKLLFPLLGLAMIFVACEKEASKELPIEAIPSSTKLVLSIKGNDKDDLFIQGDQGLKSSAITYTSYVSPGDTMFWELAEEGDILSIEDIIIISSDAGQLFKTDLIFNEDKTLCYAVIDDNFIGHAKYDIKYKYMDGTMVIVDPDVNSKPPKK